jgi:hypothetical protein
VPIARHAVLQLNKTVRASTSVVGTGLCKMYSRVWGIGVIWFGERCDPKAVVKRGGSLAFITIE